MAWQRKIPFGYMIQGGITQPSPQEADAVKHIFAQYLVGTSLLAIAEHMTTHGPRYHQHTPAWNKNMVKRILENMKYIGTGGYPRLVSDEDFAAARRQRSDRNTYAPLAAEIRPILGKTVCVQCGGRLIRGTRTHGRVYWRCQNPDCGQSVSISDEALAGLVEQRLRALAQASHLLTVPEPRQTEPGLDTIRFQNELTLALNRGGESPEYIKSLALAVAAQRYGQLPDPTPDHKLERLRAQLEEGPADADTLSALLTTAVWAVRLGPDKTVELELVNGTIITEEKEESA